MSNEANMPVVTRIEAQCPSGPLRVAAYCRVSTDLESQQSSLEAQLAHWRQVIEARGDWKLVRLYSESGASATHMETRPELMRLLADCSAGKIDLVLTKSISRFSRNTVDCLQLVRAFSALGVHIFFEKENIHTGEMEDELFLSILSSLAADESRSLSDSVKWGYQRRFERGEYKYTRPPYGYDVEDGALVVNEAEARVVREIFHRALGGAGTRAIASALNRQGVPTKRGQAWQQGTVAAILKNITYTGDLALQKTIRDEEYTAHLNHGEQDFYFVSDHHEPLIPREVYILINEKLGDPAVQLWLRELRRQEGGGVRVISAARPVEKAGDAPGRLRVAAYCRVSTDAEEQESSYEAQCLHYHQRITANPEWTLAGIYADEGITGTSTRRRDQFNAMLADCEAHRIDLILTKSISRFARNTLDCLQHIRRLKALGVAVEFEKENINTLDVKGEILLTIMASIAQQESQSISQNVRLGIQYRFQQGLPRINCSRFLGYDKSPAGKLVINAAQAAVVRRVYRDCLEGLSPEFIANNLRAEGVLSGGGNVSWPTSSVRYILTNEKYIGDLRLQKTYVSDFLSHRCKPNRGQLPQYYVEKSHEPIIPREIFFQAGEALYRRGEYARQGRTIRYGSRQALAGRFFCACGGRFWRERWHDAQWVCEKCGRPVADDRIKGGVLAAINRLPEYRRELEGRLTPPEGETRLERADGLALSVAARLALEVADTIEGRIPRASAARACSDPEEFWARTRHVRRPGPVAEWIDEDVIRIVERVVLADRATVHLRAGLALEAPDRG